MLVLTQLSLGGFVAELALRPTGLAGDGSAGRLVLSLAAGYLGLAASLLHLGRPLYAYRAILGLRHSWLSREVLAFGVFAQLATACVAAEVLAPGWAAGVPDGLLAAAVASGVCGVACSVMVYHVVRRPFWRASRGGFKFAGTTVVLGLAAALAGTRADSMLFAPLAGALAIATAAKLLFESGDRSGRDGSEPLRATAALLRGPLKRAYGLRVYLGVMGGLFFPALAVAGDRGTAVAAAGLALAASVGGELVERSLFFRAVTRPTMPGGLPS
jgi:DMSO reductase anchor subunit